MNIMASNVVHLSESEVSNRSDLLEEEEAGRQLRLERLDGALVLIRKLFGPGQKRSRSRAREP